MKVKKIKDLLRICPICSCKKGELIHTQQFVLPESYKLPKSYDVVCCIKCGFVFADVAATQEDYDKFYAESSKYESVCTASGGNSHSWDVRRFARTASDISRALPDKNSSILDVGCANGGLLERLKINGYENLAGVEASQVCALNVRKEHGIRTFVGGLFNLNINEQFDCIILSHVLEHVRDLRKALAKIRSLLNNGGILYLEVPDASSYDKYYMVPYYYFDHEHINHFDECSLKNLTAISGFELMVNEKKEIPVSEKNYPAVYGIYRKSADKGSNKRITPDFGALSAVERYVEISRIAGGQPEFDELAASQEGVIVWGAGAFTTRLLENTSLGKCNIMAFVDNDLKKQGLKIKNIMVCPPKILIGYRCPIIVSSALFNGEILEEIKKMHLSNRIIMVV